MAEPAKKFGLIDKIGSMEDATKAIKNLIDNKNKTRMSNSLKFSALCALLGFTAGFESTTEGVHLQEEHIEKIDAALAAYTQLQAGHTALQASHSTLQTEAAASAQSVIELTARVQTLNEDRDAWKTKAEDLGRQPSGNGSNPVVDADDNTNTGGKQKLPSYADPNNPINKFADSRIRKKANV